MKTLATTCLALLLLSSALASAQTERPSDAAVEARRSVLELAGAFQNDGFKVRDGHWVGKMKPNESQLIAVNLYAGNAYWFLVAGAPGSGKVLVDLLDESGQPVDAMPYEEETRAGAGYIPEYSGQFYVRVKLGQGEEVPVCLVYSYK